MYCKNHLAAQASFACSCCGSTICLDCTVQLNNKPYCKDCLEKYIIQKPIENNPQRYTKKSKFLTFCFSFVPGAGHMYLGLIKRGLSLMFLFFFGLFLSFISSDITGIRWFEGFLIPAVSVVSFCYSLFDSLATANDINAGRYVEDMSFFSYSFVRNKVIFKKELIGGILILLGLISLLHKFSSFINEVVSRVFGIDFSLSGLLMPFILILLGFYLIRKKESL